MPTHRKKRFSEFTLYDALNILGQTDLITWVIPFTSQSPSAFYLQTVERLKKHFDVFLSESAKGLLIDAILMEAIVEFDQLKIWKEAKLRTDELQGTADYLIATQARVYQAPLLCVVEAKKDDFKQGLAQCLVEMYACRYYNQNKINKINIYGIVTNASNSQFKNLLS